MRTLLVFYSLGGNTRRLAHRIANSLDAVVEEIVEPLPRRGVMGYVRSAFEAFRKKTPEIGASANDPADFDLTLIGTPVWVGSMASPVRSYMMRHAHGAKRLAFFCTLGGNGAEKAFAEMQALAGTTPAGTLAVFERNLETAETATAIAGFTARLRGSQSQTVTASAA